MGIYDESNNGLDDDEIAPGVRLNGRPDPREYLDEYRSPVNEAMGSGLDRMGADSDEIAPGVRLNGRPDPRAYIDEYRQKPPTPAPVHAKPARQDSSMLTELGRGFMRGTHQTIGTLHGARAIWNTIGEDDTADVQSAVEGYQYRERKAAEYPSSVPSFTDIEDVGTFAEYAAGKLGELLPSIIETAAFTIGGTAIGAAGGSAAGPAGTGAGAVSGGLAGLAGGVLRKSALRGFVKQQVKTNLKGGMERAAAMELAERQARDLTIKQVQRLALGRARQIGGGAGMAAGVFPLEAGGNMMEAYQETGELNPYSAMSTGAAATALEFAGGFSGLLGNLTTGRAYRKVRKEIGEEAAGRGISAFLGRLGKNAAEQIPAEFGQEFGQEFLSNLNTYMNDPETPLFDRESLIRYLDAGFAGALGGGVFTAVGTASDFMESSGKARKEARQDMDAQLEEARAGGYVSPLDEPARLTALADEEAEASGASPSGISSPWEEAGATDEELDAADTNVAVREGAEGLDALRGGTNPAREARNRGGLTNQNDMLADMRAAMEENADRDLEAAAGQMDAMRGGVSETGLSPEIEERILRDSGVLFNREPETAPQAPGVKTSAPAEIPAVDQETGLPASVVQRVLAGYGVQDEGDRIGALADEEADTMVALGRPIAEEEIASAAAQVNVEPTGAQKEAGNYRKGHVKIAGMDIAIENPKGSTRSGTDEDGNAWESTLASHYGYIKRTEGADGDQVDVFIGDRPEAGSVFVVDQINPKTGKFDEHKAMIGFETQAEAEAGYLANYDEDWQGLGAVTEMPVDEFKAWAKEGDTTKPLAYKEGKAAKSEPEEEAGVFRPEVAQVDEEILASEAVPGTPNASAGKPKKPSKRDQAALDAITGGSPEVVAEEIPAQKAMDTSPEPAPGQTTSDDEIETLAAEYAAEISPEQSRVSEYHRHFVRAVMEKRLDGGVQEMLVQGYGSNMASKRMFTKMTGIELPKTIGGIRRALDKWAGVTEEQLRAREEAKTEKAKAIEDARAAREGKESTRKAEAVRYKGGQTGREYVDELISQGFTELTKFKQGAITKYGLRKPGGNGEIKVLVRDAAKYAEVVIARMDTAAPTPASETAPAAPAATDTSPEAGAPDIVAGSAKLAAWVAENLREGKAFARVKLWKAADKAFGGTRAEGTYTPKDAFDAMEMGVNQFIEGRVKPLRPGDNSANAYLDIEFIREKVMKLIASQDGFRTEEMDEFQQFSTPPDYAYVMAWLADIHGDAATAIEGARRADVVLEPSAGVGGLAIFAKIAQARVIVNELSKRRAALLETMGFDRVFTENAEQVNNILPADVKPTVVIMNPPFSSTAGRMKGKANTSKNAIAHIEQALKRLVPGGRLVALVGKGFNESNRSIGTWWRKASKEYDFRANILIEGEGYKKYGTTYENRILVIDKQEPTGRLVNSTVSDVADVVSLLEDVRNDRARIEQAAPESVSQGDAAEGEGQGGAGVPVRPATAPVVAGTQPGRQEHGGIDRPGGSPDVSVEPGGRDAVPDGNRSGRRGGGGGLLRRPDAEAGLDAGSVGAVPAEQLGTDRVHGVGDEGTLNLETKTRGQSGAITDSVFDKYTPAVTVKGAVAHPAKLVESAAMAAVAAPPVTYTPHIPTEVVKSGALSDAQLETIIHAGQAHSTKLANGERRGYFIGDGTGVGKGREISGIMLDNHAQGRDRAVWISENTSLMKDAQRDWSQTTGREKGEVFSLNATKTGQSVTQPRGILYAGYSTLAKGVIQSSDGKVERQNKAVKSRLDQVVDWFGADFDGVIVFDEAHNMQNNQPKKGARGIVSATLRSLAGIELMRRLPNARIVYVSATGATQIENLGYAERAGLWGEGTPFPDKASFIESMGLGGVGSMEVIARDMKAMGVYSARNLSYEDVTYGKIVHDLTPEQSENYDILAEAWQTVLQNINDALSATGAGEAPGAKSSAYSKFWGSHQRFFNQIITSMQMPSVIADAKARLEAGESVIFQLVNTNEAQANRKAAQIEDQNYEELDLTPREILIQYVESAFPVAQYESYTDDDGNIRSRPVVDSSGNPVMNAEALAMKEILIDRIGDVRTPDGPLEIILNELGAENVAEVTGRTQRFVYQKNKRVRESRTPKKADQEADEFQAGKRRALVFSYAGGTGRSFHADLSKKNQQKRVHYLVQPGWRADKAVQGFGRSHRTNAASSPHYVLVTTNLKGQKRFISSIARRLDQLGALTKGQRETGSQGMFGMEDNLESQYAKDANTKFFMDLYRGNVEGLDFAETTKAMGLDLIDENGGLNTSRIPEITRFLNRVLSLKVETQNKVFDAFHERMMHNVEAAKLDGTLDVGMETYRADGGVKVIDRKPVYTHPESGSVTEYVKLEARHSTKRVTFNQAHQMVLPKGGGFYRNKRSGKLWAVMPAGTVTLTNGKVEKRYRAQGQAVKNAHYMNEGYFTRGEFEWQKYEEVPAKDARKAWDEALAKTPEFHEETINLITGVLLPIWDRLPQDRTRIYRVQTVDGERFLGRLLHESDVAATLEKLGAKADAQKVTPENAIAGVMEKNATVTLANGWQVKRRTVQGEYRIEIVASGGLLGYEKEFAKAGVIKERIQFVPRFFIPTGDSAVSVLKKVTRSRPIISMQVPHSTGDAKFATMVPGEHYEQTAEKRTRDTLRDAGLNRKRLAAVSRAVESEYGTRIPEGVLEIVDSPVGSANIQEIAGLFGKRVIYLRNNAPKAAPFHGLYLRSDPGAIYVVTNSKRSHLSILGHELLHAIRAEDSGLFDRFAKAVDKEVVGFKDYSKRYGLGHGQNIVIEEFLSDVMGNRFASASFWNKLARKQPSLIRRVAGIVRAFLSRVRQALVGPGVVDDYLADIEAVERAAASVILDYIKLKNKPTWHSIKKGLKGVQRVRKASGTYHVDLQNGATLQITESGEVNVDRAALEAAYGRQYKGEPRAAFIPMKKGGIIQLGKYADLGDIQHELFHAAMYLSLDEAERRAVLKEYGVGDKPQFGNRRWELMAEERAAQAYMRWRGPDIQPHGMFGKVREFFRSLGELLFGPDIESVFGRIRSGEVFKRPDVQMAGVSAVRYSVSGESAGLQDLPEGSAEAKDGVRRLAVAVYEAGAKTFYTFRKAMREALGGLWQQFQSIMRELFNVAAEHAKNQAMERAASEMTDEQRRVFAEKFPAGAPDPGIRDKYEAVRGRIGKIIKQKVFDQFSAILDIGKTPYMLARLTKSAPSALYGMLEHGKLRMTADGVLTLDTVEKGFIPRIQAMLGPEIDRFLAWVAVNRAELLMEEGRENWFSPEDIRVLKTLDQGRMGDGNARAQVYQQANAMLNEFHKSVLDIGESAGIINPEGRAMWQREFYVPFYRHVEDDGGKQSSRGVKIVDGFIRQKAFEQLKGRSLPLNDLLANTIANWYHLINASLKNQAGLKTLRMGEARGHTVQVKDEKIAEDGTVKWGEWMSANGVYLDSGSEFYAEIFDQDSGLVKKNPRLRFIPRTEKPGRLPVEITGLAHMAYRDGLIAVDGVSALVEAMGNQQHRPKPEVLDAEDTVFVREGGKPVYFKVLEPELLESISALNYDGLNWGPMKVFSAFKRAMTYGVTASPDFKIRNLFRDSIHAPAVSSDLHLRDVLGNVWKGIKSTSKKDLSYVRMLVGGGAMDFGHMDAADPKAARERIMKRYGKAEILDNETGWKAFKAAVLKAKDAWDEIGNRGENANRVAQYLNAIESGKSELVAQFEARDLMDFSLTGSWVSIRALAQIVPFFNARLQGLYKLGRAGMDKNQRRDFMTVMGTVMLASALLYLYNKDDEEYKELEDWERDTYWHFKIPGTKTFFKLPRPFEIGSMGTMAERTLEQMVDDSADMQLFAERMKFNILEIFAFDPIPQAFKPALEVYSNYNRFMDRPIESTAMQNLHPTERKNVWTSETAGFMSKVADTLTWGNVTLSPVQADHMIRGYFGWLGAVATGAADQVFFKPFMDEGEDTARAVQEYPLLKVFLKNADPTRHSRYETIFYEQLREINQSYATYRQYIKLGQTEKVVEYAREHGDHLALRKIYNKLQRRLGDINGDIRRIHHDGTMSADEKRVKIDRLTQVKNRMVRMMAEREGQ